MRHSIVVAGLLLIPLVSTAYATPSAQELLATIRKTGARAVLAQLSTHEDEFTAVCTQIETGDAEWLEVARRLRRVSDAAVAESLDMAAARALPRSPAGVLGLVDRGFTLEGLCTVPFVEGDAGAELDHLQRAQAALRGDLPIPLDELRRDCLVLLKKAKRQLEENASR